MHGSLDEDLQNIAASPKAGGTPKASEGFKPPARKAPTTVTTTVFRVENKEIKELPEDKSAALWL